MISSIKQWFISKKKLLLVNLLFIVSYFQYQQGFFKSLENSFEQNALYLSNLKYLENLSFDLMSKFSELLAFSSIIDVANTSKLGISFFVDINIEVGQLLENFSDLLNKGMEYLLISLASVEFLDLLLKFFEMVSPLLFKLLMIYCFAWFFIALFHEKILHLRLAHNIMNLLIGVLIFIHIAFPYSIHLSAELTKVNGKELEYKSSKQYFNNITMELSNNKINNNKKHSDLKQHAEHGVSVLKKTMATNLHQKIQQSTTIIIKSMVYQFLTIIIIPFLFSLLLYLFFKRVLAWHPFIQRIGLIKDIESKI